MPRKPGLNPAVSQRIFGQLAQPRKHGVHRLYARVSTHDQQTLPLRHRALRDYVGRRRWTIAIDIKGVGSGASVRELRQKLLEATRRRDIDVVAVWRLDCPGRWMAALVPRFTNCRSRS